MTNIKKTTQIDNHNHHDDEIDLIELIKTIWKNKITILIITSIFVIVSIIYSFTCPKEYKSIATFFITENEKPNNTLAGYASMLGVNSPSNIANLIQNVLGSYSIKVNIAKEFKDLYKNDIKKAINNQSLINHPNYINNYLIEKLQLNNNLKFKVTKNNLFVLEYRSNDKTLTKKVLTTCLNQIIIYNESLELSAERNILTIIDAPLTPLTHFKPKKKLNVIIGFILGLILSILTITIKTTYNSYNKKILNK